MERLFHRANRLTDRHVRHLDLRRRRKVLYKRIRPNGRPHGRAFGARSKTFRDCQQNGTVIRRLHDEEKRGDDNKYRIALQKILYPCERCGGVPCPYCNRSPNGARLPDDRLQKIFFTVMKDTHWRAYRQENNFAPTKQVLGLLRKDARFMRMLVRRMLAENAPVPRALTAVAPTMMAAQPVFDKETVSFSWLVGHGLILLLLGFFIFFSE